MLDWSQTGQSKAKPKTKQNKTKSFRSVILMMSATARKARKESPRNTQEGWMLDGWMDG